MARRIHVSQLRTGDIRLDRTQSHHVRNVLRLEDGAIVEVFDDAGQIARAIVLIDGSSDVSVRVGEIEPETSTPALRWTVASAVPKGERADWMVEKLAELGTAAFIPLAAARSVVLPEGKNKHDRWVRIATEAAKQSRRPGVMRIEPLTGLADAVKQWRQASAGAGWFLATEVAGTPIAQAVVGLTAPTSVTVFVGPEGGWTNDEVRAFEESGMTAVRLTTTILRVETAAMASAAILSAWSAHLSPRNPA